MDKNSFKALNDDSNTFGEKISYSVSTSSVYKMHLQISFKNKCRSSGLHATLQSANVSHNLLKGNHQAAKRQQAELLKHCSFISPTHIWMDVDVTENSCGDEMD